MRWFLLAAVIAVFGQWWFWEGRELRWSVRVRCEDARGQPIAGVGLQIAGMGYMGAEPSFDGDVYTVEFRKGHLDSIADLLGGSEEKGLSLDATSPAHGRLRKALAANDPLRFVFPDPAWLTVKVDPVPSEADRADSVLVVVGCGPDSRFWPEDRDLSEHMAEDGSVRVGPLVPGDYDVRLAKKQGMDGGGWFIGWGFNEDPGPGVSFGSGENQYVLRS